MRFSHDLSYADAEPAVDQVLFRHHDRPGLLGSPNNGVAVERLDGVHVDYARRNPIGFERLGGAKRFGYQQSRGDQRDVRAFRQFDRLPDGELLVRRVYHWRLGAAGANEYRALELDRRFDQLHHRHFVGRTHHYEPRQRTGQADVLDAHLRRSILADRDPAVRPHRFQIDVGKRRGDAQLLEALVEHEGGKTRHERNFSRRGEAGADRNHVRLGDSALEKAIGKLLAELGRVGGLGEIRVEYDDVRVSAPQLDERLAEGLARGRAEFPFEFRLRDHYASSRKARAASSRVGAIP